MVASVGRKSKRNFLTNGEDGDCPGEFGAAAVLGGYSFAVTNEGEFPIGLNGVGLNGVPDSGSLIKMFTLPCLSDLGCIGILG